ncbi:MAG: translation initiation factor IF-2 [Halanaerobiales bacterium]|nr:translation initiation factor IF-2 [Halanaerobiales bacterium]
MVSLSKIRVYKLADKLNMKSKELIDILNKLGVEVSSHMSTVEDDTAELVEDMVNEENKTETEQETNNENQSEVNQEKESVSDEKTKAEDLDENEEVEESDEDLEPITEGITIRELSEKIDYPANNIIKTMMQLGIMTNVNYSLDEDEIQILKDELDLKVKITDEIEVEEDEDSELQLEEIIDKPEDLKPRPPIVTVMGHVDHGKTTLLDVIRKTRVAEGEAGGITQHIGAYQALYKDKKITFIDTPGHEAFTAMRARGAQLTDIVILVVAADDGIMPQTVEAINHAQAAGIPIIVAINKIDKANAQPDRVKQELTEHGLVPEEWGGNTICVAVSALQGENIDELLEMVTLASELEELKANPDRVADGIIIESELDRGRGPIATVLVKNGTLKVGDYIIAGSITGRVKALLDEHGERVEKAEPASPVIVLGFNDVPEAGQYLRVMEDEREAKELAGKRKDKRKEERLNKDSKVSLEDLYRNIQEGDIKELNVIIKADVQGSIAALEGSLLNIKSEEVGVKIIHTGVGAINETDVNLASASNAIIIGFNVRPGTNARKAAEKEKVEIKTYRVIYKVIEDIKNAMSGLLEPEYKEIVVGSVEVRDTFKVPDVGIIAGAYVKEGEVNRNDYVRLLRNGVVIHEGDISSLKRFENDVREVKEGYECGIGIENYNDIKVEDILEIYRYKEIERSL